MMDDAELRGFTTKIAGETEIDDAHNTDQQRQFWTNLLAEGAKRDPDQAADRRRPSSSTASTSAPDAVNNAWANTADGDQRTSWEVNATNGVGQMNYEAYLGLVHACSSRAPSTTCPPGFKDHGEMQGLERHPDRTSAPTTAAVPLTRCAP